MKTTMNMTAHGNKIKDTEKESLRMQALERFEEYCVKTMKRSKS
jgi:hypothetical protein